MAEICDHNIDPLEHLNFLRYRAPMHKSDERFGKAATSRVARRYFFKPKMSNWTYFGGPWNRHYFVSIWNMYFKTIWYFSWPFGIPILR
jgi:hypothetical protein